MSLKTPLLCLFCLVWVASPSTGQTPQPLKILTEADGLYEITASELSRHWDLVRIPAAQLALTREGRQVPIQIRGGRDGKLDPGDRIVFFGERNRSAHTHKTAYILGFSRAPRHMRTLDPRRFDKTTDEAIRSVVLEQDEIYEPLRTINMDAHDPAKKAAGWYWKSIAAAGKSEGRASAKSQATFVADISPEPRRRVPGRFYVELLAPPVEGQKHTIAININGRDLPAQSIEGGLRHRLEWRVPAGIIERKNSVQIRNLTQASHYSEPGNDVRKRFPNRLLIDRIEFRFSTLLIGVTSPEDHMMFDLVKEDLSPEHALSFSSFTQDGYIFYDVGRKQVLRSDKLMPLPRGNTRVAIAGLQGLQTPEIVSFKKTRAHQEPAGADYVVISTERLAPLLEPLIKHRQRMGHTVVAVTAKELYDTFTHGDFDPNALRLFLKRAHKRWKLKPKYVLLVGDADLDVDWRSTKETLPTFQVATTYNGRSGTDFPLADLDGDGTAELCVGRLPARTSDDLFIMTARIIDSEVRAPKGAWRRQTRFIAGMAGFGEAADTLLERMVKQTLREDIPPAFDIAMTWANPKSSYYWPLPGFADRVVAEWNEGAALFTYIGHGSVSSFDRMRSADGKLRSILDAARVEDLNAQGKSPLLTLLACSTGAFDLIDKDSIAELIMRKRGGALGVIAASRISHPWPNALLGQALAKLAFTKNLTVGEILKAAQKEVRLGGGSMLSQVAKPFLSNAVDSERLLRDQVNLYNLLGDPAQRLPFPSSVIELTAQSALRPGMPLQVTYRVPEGATGELLITLERPAGQSTGFVPTSDPQAIVRNHASANKTVLSRTTATIPNDKTTVQLQVPTGLKRGNYRIKAYLTSAHGGEDAMGSLVMPIGQ